MPGHDETVSPQSKGWNALIELTTEVKVNTAAVKVLTRHLEGLEEIVRGTTDVDGLGTKIAVLQNQVDSLIDEMEFERNFRKQAKSQLWIGTALATVSFIFSIILIIAFKQHT